MKCQILFCLSKIRKISVCHLLNLPREWQRIMKRMMNSSLFDIRNLSLRSMDTLVKHSVFQKSFLLNYPVPS